MPPGQQQQQGGGSTDQGMAPIWITALLIAVVAGLWYWAHKEIVTFLFWLNLIQAKVVLVFIDSARVKEFLYVMQTVDPGQVQWADVVSTTSFIGLYTRYPVILLFIFFAAYLYYKDVPLRFRKTYSMGTLRKQEQVNWPAIMPVVNENLIKVDIDTGPWAMSLLPMEFAKKYNLLRKDDALLDNNTPGLEMTAGLRKGEAKRIFTLQLGPYWEGFERCAPHVQALAAIFIARMNRDRNAAKKILDELNKSFAEHKINFAVAKATLKKYQQKEEVQEVVQKHGYVLTVMASLLIEARKDGVLPSAEFLWLKIIDRRLWYMLNSVGRQTPFTEVGGPFAHWLAENAMRRCSRVPMIDEAITGLEGAIKAVKLTPKQMQELKP